MLRILFFTVALFSVLNNLYSQQDVEIMQNIIKMFPENTVFEYNMNTVFTDKSKGDISL